MTGDGAKVSFALKGIKGSMKPSKFAGELQRGKESNLLWLCWIWVPKSLILP